MPTLVRAPAPLRACPMVMSNELVSVVRPLLVIAAVLKPEGMKLLVLDLARSVPPSKLTVLAPAPAPSTSELTNNIPFDKRFSTPVPVEVATLA